MVGVMAIGDVVRFYEPGLDGEICCISRIRARKRRLSCCTKGRGAGVNSPWLLSLLFGGRVCFVYAVFSVVVVVYEGEKMVGFCVVGKRDHPAFYILVFMRQSWSTTIGCPIRL